MVQFYRKTHTYPEPPPTPLLAFFLRYPNPFARHVLSVDVLERTVDPSTGRIKTVRLILKRGIVPQWASKFLPVAKASGGRGLDAWVLEESVVDPPGWGKDPEEALAAGPPTHHVGSEMLASYREQPRLRVWQANLSFKKFMHVIEGGELCAGPDGSTMHHTTAEVRSQFGGSWSQILRDKIESYGIGKFEGNTEHSRKGMSLILGLLRRREMANGSIDTSKLKPEDAP
ncbi:hypothetical protein CcaverHIS002_0104380 [Cutaneotrichosporon cavernicola]|uniref:PRELI/MSF1 domain-containing protein n=1 Tax=Cutaneotrichosporon cavernicola TaxID=279322 RepID=A0AA48HY90_9TREE|nr:uncharacterized protein CcaverHIS019_0104320 [Cutaneotrichosporon cavernicola]BEI79909.1 hypothetical protein CcaverHIS002_0104380 [Cutaneotrichosporon cavernicola]BEI87714.1 hypothetical protein CcaverHIS019_0104320 [Cutaneotrichosporon cavernicola]BEI95485.1 hypothetical protein CcaverHIS631_0104340 [Cutaneotrichosporon cavernicola]BEJ03259.1 hypothetical protein CcaverHIS641_0104340 [Cutaneotrichosporon cavernicola]